MSKSIKMRPFVRWDQRRNDMFAVSTRVCRQRKLFSQTRCRRYVYDLFHGRAVCSTVHSGIVGNYNIVFMSPETRQIIDVHCLVRIS